MTLVPSVLAFSDPVLSSRPDQRGRAVIPGSGTAVVRAATVVPVILLVLFAGLLGLLGLLCGRERRKYVINLHRQAMSTAGTLMHGPGSREPAGQKRSGGHATRSSR